MLCITLFILCAYIVLTLVGVCVDSSPAPYILMPFMSHGSLLSYLKKERHNLTVAEGSDQELVSPIQKQLLSMCLQKQLYLWLISVVLGDQIRAISRPFGHVKTCTTK